MKYWSRLAKGLDPYVPGEQPKDRKYIKLNTNENPYGPSPKVLEALKEAADDALKLYPDPACTALVEKAAEYYGVDNSMIFPGNGSDEILAFAFMAFFDPGKSILFPDITYSFYPVYAKLFNIDYTLVETTENFDIPVEKLYGSEGGVVLANPNAPTGKFLDLDKIELVLMNNKESVVIVDEAYIDFGGETVVGLVKKYPNLLVVHTFSKSRALAGIRLGFAIGDPGLVKALDSVKNSFNSYTIDRLSMAAGIAAFEDVEYFEDKRKKVIATREWTSRELIKLGFKVFDSASNFIFVTHETAKALDLFMKLRENGILVRYFKQPRIDNHLRITIGTDQEMEKLIETFKKIL